MASTSHPQGTYTPEQGTRLHETGLSANPVQLFCALDLMIQVLGASGISYALMGGLSLRYLGSTRVTHDVDLTVGCTMHQLLTAISGQSRILRPLGPTSGVLRIFVYVGGSFNPNVEELWVTVDLILRGSLGAPDNPLVSSEILSRSTDIGERQYRVLNIQSLLASKLGAFFARTDRNDYTDISWILGKYPQEVYEARLTLNAEHKSFFIAAANRMEQGTQSANRIRRYKAVLGVV